MARPLAAAAAEQSGARKRRRRTAPEDEGRAEHGASASDAPEAALDAPIEDGPDAVAVADAAAEWRRDDALSVAPRFQRNSNGYVPGSIVRVACENFVTYDAVEFCPGPYLNMIIGPNGTGKSTVVCAIALGLGWKPEILGRAKDVASFVKLGHESGWVEIELQGFPGQENVVIRRVMFRESSSSDWVLNGRAASAKEINDAVVQFHIDIGNLCTFLPQDKVADFARMSPPRLLQETQRISGHPQLIEWHMQLIELGHTLGRLQTRLDQDRHEHDHLEQRNTVLERDVRRYEERQDLEKREALLQLHVLFAKYREAKERYDAARADREEAKGKLRSQMREVEPVERELRSTEEQSSALREDARRCRERTQQQLLQAKRAAQEKEKLDGDIMALNDQEKHVESTESERRARIAQLRERIASLEEQVADEPVEEDTAKLELRLRSLRTEERSAAADLQDLDTQRVDLSRASNRLLNQMNEARASLSQMDSVRHQRLQILERGDKDSFLAIQWLRKNRNIFQKKVYDPVLIELGISRPEAARAIESCINWPTQRTFVCQCRADYDLFTRELIDRRGWRLNVVEMEGTKALDAYQSPLPLEQVQRLGFSDYAINCIEAPEDILRFLCSSSSLHNIPVAFRGNVDPEAVERARVLRRYIIGDTIFTITYSNYGRRLPQTMSRELKPARNFARSGNLEEKRRAEELVLNLQGELDQTQSQIRDLDQQEQSLRQMRADLVRRRDALMGELHLAKRARNEWEKTRVSLQTERTRLSQEENRPSAAAQRQRLFERRKAKALELAAVAHRLRETLQNLMENRREQDVAVLKELHVDSRIERIKEQLREKNNLVREAQQELETVLEAFSNAKEEALACKDRANALLNESEPSIVEIFQEQHAAHEQESADQLEMQLVRTQAALDVPWGVGANIVETFRERKAKVCDRISRWD